MISLAQRITELRTEKGMSRPELSAALGLPKNAIEKFETGRQTPPRSSRPKWPPTFKSPSFISGGRATTPPGRMTG